MENKSFLVGEGISIVTIVLNQRDLIEQTIKSVLNQKDVDIEYIVIDGGSTDGTVEIIELYREQIHIFISEPDGGIYEAINKGISLSTKPLIGLIHCGDFYVENILKKVYDKYLETNADVIYGNIDIVEKVGDSTINRFPIANHKLLKNKMSIFHPSTFITFKTYEKFGLYDVNYRLAADYDFLLKLFLNNCCFQYLNEVISVFRAEGISSKNVKLSLEENIRIRRCNIGRINSIKFFFLKSMTNLFFSLRKKTIILIVGEKKYNKIKSEKYAQQ